MQTIEQWKPIPNYEKWYHVSNTGKVRSLGREVSGRDKNGKYYRIVKPEILLKPGYANGYARVILCGNESKKSFFVHLLVANAFIPKVEGKNFINHIKGKQNNYSSNLEWCTRSENQLHAVATGLQKPHYNHPFKKSISALIDNKIVHIAQGVRDLCRQLNLDRRSVSRVIAGKIKTHKGYTFKINSDQSSNF